MAMERHFGRIAWALPLITGLGVLMVTVGHGFAFDDPVAVVDNPLVDGTRPWVDAVTSDFWGDRPGFEHIASWRPVTIWSLRLDHALGDGAPWAFHLTNGLLHLLVALAAGFLALTLGFHPVLRLAVSMAVLVTPAFSEAVASIVGRGDLLAALFGIAGVAWIRTRPRLALAMLCVGLLSKETAAVYALTAGVWALAGGLRGRFVAVGALGLAWYIARSLVVGHLGGDVPPVDNPLVAMAFGERFVAGLGIVGRYVAWWIGSGPVPADVAAGVTHGGVHAAVGAAAVLGLVGIAVHAWRERSPALVGVTLALSSFALLSNILFVLPTPAAGRLAYHPGLGLTLTLVTCLGMSTPRSTLRHALTLSVLVLLVGVWSTIATLHSWADDAALFAQSVESEPDSARSRSNLARVQLDAGELDSARAHLEAALERVPGYPLALLNLSVVRERQSPGDPEAWALALRAASVAPRPGKAQANVCALAMSRPALDPAQVLASCQVGATALPGAPEPQTNLARALARAGDHAAAEAAFVAALAAHPGHPFVLGHRIGYLAGRGRTEPAVALQRQVFAASPTDAAAHRNLVALLLKHAGELAAAGQAEAACAAAMEAASLAPSASSVAARAAALCGR